MVEFEEHLGYRERMSLVLTIDDIDFDIASLNKWAKCKIGIADISMVNIKCIIKNVNILRISFKKGIHFRWIRFRNSCYQATKGSSF